jgi:hypothetical protein
MHAHCGYALLWSVRILSLTPLPPHPFFNSFQYTSLCLLPSHFMICDTTLILFSFPFFPKFHRVVPLLQTCSTTEFVYDYACFCVYVYLWIYLQCIRENMHLLCFWSWLTSLNMMTSNCIHLPSNPMSFIIPCGWVIPPLYFMIHSSVIGNLDCSRAWLLWIVLWWTSVNRCLYWILFYIVLG